MPPVGPEPPEGFQGQFQAPHGEVTVTFLESVFGKWLTHVLTVVILC